MMYFILLEDVGSLIAGDLLSATEMQHLLMECEGCETVNARCFPSQDHALEWNECQEGTNIK